MTLFTSNDNGRMGKVDSHNFRRQSQVSASTNNPLVGFVFTVILAVLTGLGIVYGLIPLMAR